jgi:hypothetical protein
LGDIRAKLVELIQGTAAGGERMPAAGRFLVVGDDHLVQQADAADDTPRPVYIEAGYEVQDPTLPSDVSGDMMWKARVIPIWVPYAYSPDHTVVQRDSIMDDDEDILERVLREPLNLSPLVAGWAKSRPAVNRQDSDRDADGVVAIRWLSIMLAIAYQEDWAT